MFGFRQRGNFKNLESFFARMLTRNILNTLHHYGRLGVQHLSDNTPVDTGQTAQSWSYEIESGLGTTTIVWKNSNVNKGLPIAILLQYGHGTNNGGYVSGIDYINPALAGVFEQFAKDIWREVTR